MSNVTLPATGTGTATPVIEAATGPSSAARQVVTIGDLGGNAVDSVGGLTETAPSTDTASSGLNGRLQRVAQNVTTLNTSVGTTNSSLTTINTSVGTVNTSVGTVNTTLGTTNSSLTTINTSVGTVNTSVGSVNTTLGTTNTEIGALTETAPSTDTASSGLNGRLQRVAQRITSLLALLPSALTPAGALKTGSVTVNPTSTFTRPSDTTAYTAGDLLATSTSAGSVAVPSFTATPTSGGSGHIQSARLITNKTSGMAGVALLIDFWQAAPTFTNGDNGVYAPATGAANWLGQMAVTLAQAGDGAYGAAGPTVANAIDFALASGTTIYWTLQTSTAFTPASAQTFTIIPEILQD